MSQTKQILLAFLIPFSLAVGLASLGDYFFPQSCMTAEINGETVCFSYDERGWSFVEGMYTFLVIGLFLASLILPPFITRRAYQSKRSELKATSVFK